MILLPFLCTSQLLHLILMPSITNPLLSPPLDQNKSLVLQIITSSLTSSLPMHLRGPQCLKRRGSVMVHVWNIPQNPLALSLPQFAILSWLPEFLFISDV